MGFFLKKSHGSITVFLVLILVPSIFFVGFMDDLARMKLYSNQAVMTADNYGEAILTEYDCLMKELYGIFAVTQDEEAIKDLEIIERYMASSFNPNVNVIGASSKTAEMGGALYRGDASVWNVAGYSPAYKGMMPYANMNASLTHNFVESSSLRNDDIFATEVGDFMRYRIVQTLLDGEGNVKIDELMEAIDAVADSAQDDVVAARKEELQKPLEDYMEAITNYYDCLTKIKSYDEYIGYGGRDNAGYGAGFGIIDKQDQTMSDILDVAASEEYGLYEYVTKNKKSIQNLISTHDTNNDGKLTSSDKDYDKLDKDEKEYVAFYQDYDNRKKDLALDFRDYYNDLLETGLYKNGSYYTEEGRYINFSNYDQYLDDLLKYAKEVEKYAGDLDEAVDALQEALNAEGVTEEIKETEQENVNKLKKLVAQLDVFSDIQISIADVHTGKTMNAEFKAAYEDSVKKYDSIIESYMNLTYDEDKAPWPDFLQASKLYRFYTDDSYSSSYTYYEADNSGSFKEQTKTITYKSFYDELTQTIGSGDSDQKAGKKKAKKLQNVAKRLTGKYKLEDDKDGDNVRDIPQFLLKEYGEYYSKGESVEASFERFASMAGNLTSLEGAQVEANRLLLKGYMMQYDFGMFSSRVTNVKYEESKDSSLIARSLTGYEMAKNINYMYKGELEYLVAGNGKAQDNLDSTRNKIVAFRMLTNYTSTYTIKELNRAITQVTSKLFEIPYAGPALAIIVDIAIRSAIASVESYFDWQDLMKGEGVVVFKRKLEELQMFSNCGDELTELMDNKKVTSDSGSGSDSKSFELDYNQYLMIMLLFFTDSDKVFQRTQNLIELNTNCVNAELGEDGELTSDDYKIRLAKAYTAVESTCTVDGDFIVLPEHFVNLMLSDKQSVKSGLRSFEKNKFSYKVIRSY